MEKQVTTITRDSLEYLDELGVLQRIEFQECHNRWMAMMLKNYPDSAEYIRQGNKDYKCVGQRNLYGDNENGRPYIEFCTDPVTRFEFSSRYEGFDEIIYKLRKSRWLTSDLA